MKQHVFFKNLLILAYAFLMLALAYYKHEGSFVSRLSTALIFFISTGYFLKCLLLKGKKLFFKSWTFFLLLNIFSFVFTATYSDVRHYGMFIGILLTFLPFYPFYYFARQGCFRQGQLRTFFLMMIPVYLYAFYVGKARILEDMGIDFNLVNNHSYSFVALMPIVFFIRKRVYSSSILILCLIMIIQGSKRGAMIAGGLVLLVYFYYLLRYTKSRNNSFRLLGAVVFILLLAFLVHSYYLSNEFARDRFSEIEDGSGRSFIYAVILDYWYRSGELWRYLFGFGFSSSIAIAGIHAHNDWLELLSNIGLVGFFAYLVLYLSSIKAFMAYKWNSVEKYLFLSIILIWLVSSLVSMWYTNTMVGYLYAVLLAYLVGTLDRGSQTSVKSRTKNEH